MLLLYKECIYSRLGTLVAMALRQGGGALRLFCPSVFHYLCGMSPTEIIVGLNEVSDTSVKSVLEKVRITLRVLNRVRRQVKQIQLCFNYFRTFSLPM